MVRKKMQLGVRSREEWARKKKIGEREEKHCERERGGREREIQ